MKMKRGDVVKEWKPEDKEMLLARGWVCVEEDVFKAMADDAPIKNAG